MRKTSLSAILFTVLLSTNAHAQVFFEQGKVNLSVNAGDHVNDTLVINNTSNKAVKVKVYWEDFNYQPPFDGGKKFFPAGTLPNSMSRWVEFSPREFSLPPFGKKNIAYTMNVPADVKGGYYGVLFAEPENPELNSGDKGVKIITRVGCLFFTETSDRDKRGSLDDVSFSGCRLKGRLQNEGDVILLPQATYYVMDREGSVVDRGELQKYYLPPGEVADVDLPLQEDIDPGEYTLVLTFDLDGGDVLVKEIDFTKSSDIQCRINTVRD